MIGDFDSSANPLWTLYGKEARNHDTARIQTLKDDMDGVLIFAGLFSAVLTTFVIDSKESLKANTADQTVYYLQQNVAMLSQISQQISFIAPQFTIPSTPRPFTLLSTRRNLISILSAALLAILVQKWVRDYMVVFERYDDPLKSARIRQYLYEGSERWHMLVIAEVVPALLHISLFLFFAGLGDFVLDINTSVGLSTTIPIGIICLLYIFTVFAPVIYPQSPYHNSFSALIWYLIQKLQVRRYKDRDGRTMVVNSNMVKGRLELAMEETECRKERDVEAVRWMLDNLTEDSEMEAFAMAIPGSFNGAWSFEVWKKMSHLTDEGKMSTDQNEPAMGLPTDIEPHAAFSVTAQPSPRFGTIPNLSGSLVRPFRTSTARASTPTNMTTHTPPLHSANIDLPVITTSIHGETLLRGLSRRMAHLFETCTDRGVFPSDEQWRRRTRACVEATASLIFYADAELGWFGDILRSLGDIGNVEGTRELSLTGKDQAFVMRWTCLSTMAIRQMLGGNESLKACAGLAVASIRDLQGGDGTDDEEIEDLGDSDFRISTLQSKLDKDTYSIIQQYLVKLLSLFTCPANLCYFLHIPQRTFRALCEMLEMDTRWTPKKLLQRQLWRFQDLRDADGFGFTIELFLLALQPLLSTSGSRESSSALFIGTLRVITSDWRKHKHCLATQKILLDVVASAEGILHLSDYPTYITDWLWKLLGDMLEGQSGPHMENAVQELTDCQHLDGHKYGAKALEVISRLQAPPSNRPGIL
ncbi:hypothetical protein BC826DRAFT_1051702 [Russula brevipes]|nr:hypothetical protein BC826DRAFT_1051702 [Russula brevipes]